MDGKINTSAGTPALPPIPENAGTNSHRRQPSIYPSNDRRNNDGPMVVSSDEDANEDDANGTGGVVVAVAISYRLRKVARMAGKT